ncbi:MAG TPA: hypothetical protein VE173_13155, partial [Longimicrobiales bacterium]|nr:hypothetical protein [Longimicrobiales bacterium]
MGETSNMSDPEGTSVRHDEPDPAALPLTPEERRSLKILIVDDDETLLDSSVSVLETEGYQVKAVAQGSRAEDRLRDGTADIVL